MAYYVIIEEENVENGTAASRQMWLNNYFVDDEVVPKISKHQSTNSIHGYFKVKKSIKHLIYLYRSHWKKRTILRLDTLSIKERINHK